MGMSAAPSVARALDSAVAIAFAEGGLERSERRSSEVGSEILAGELPLLAASEFWLAGLLASCELA